MANGSAYILLVRPERRETLLASEPKYLGAPQAVEPVPPFNHSKRAPLLVLASFQDGFLTHISEGRKGATSGTELVRLNMKSLEALRRPIAFETAIDAVEPRFRPILSRVLDNGGLLPPKTLRAVVEALSRLDRDLARRLERLSESRARLIAELSAKERESLALQKETLSVALEIAGVGTGEVLSWTPGTTAARTSFLDGLPETHVREDVMLYADMSTLPGFEAISEAPYLASRTFQSETDSDVRLTVVMANRLPLEQQTGADLVYFNERYRSFVMVQYKALEKGEKEHEFRWKDGDQFADEIKRMDELLAFLQAIEPDADPDGFRLTANPFFLKFCSRIVFNPDDRGLFPGIYLPHGLWKMLAASTRLKGPRSGNVLTYANVGRRMSGPEFISLVAGAWVGTTISQSASLNRIIRSVMATGRTVTLAVKRSPPSDPVGDSVFVPQPTEGTQAELEQVYVRITE